MLTIVIISALVAGASAGYASSQYAGTGTSSGLYNQVNSNSDYNGYADKYPYTNTGYNGGFTSNYIGSNGAGAAAGSGSFNPGFAPYQPVPVFPNVFDFNSFFQGLQANFANMYQQQLAHQNALFSSIRQQQASFANAPHAGGNFNGAGYAGASAAYGPSGVHQTAQIYPENVHSPNVNTRFGASDSAQSGDPGYVGVSSFSSSSNVNGQSHREAVTSVNENGKVTTYRVRS